MSNLYAVNLINIKWLFINQSSSIWSVALNFIAKNDTKYAKDEWLISVSVSVSPAMPVLPESMSPAVNIGNLNKHFRVCRRRCRRGDLNGSALGLQGSLFQVVHNWEIFFQQSSICDAVLCSIMFHNVNN